MSDFKHKWNLLVILGPTATGKTQLAAELAFHIDAEIISADSRQIYRKMNLGTGKDYDDYLVHGKQIPYHLIDIKDPGYKYNVYEYQQNFLEAYTQVTAKGNRVILCGGTGMYIEAVTKGYKLISVPVNKPLRKRLENKSLNELEAILEQYKKVHNRSDTDTIKRAIRAIEIEEYYKQNPVNSKCFPKLKPVYIGTMCSRDRRRERITERLKTRLNEGLIDEVQSLLDHGISPEDLIYYGLEYKYLTQYLIGELDYNTMFRNLNTAIHQFAKRQMTWFRRMERQGIHIHWIDSELTMEHKLELALNLL